MLDHWSDCLSITWNFYFGATGVLFNVLLVFFVFKHTPDYMRVYATVIRVGAIGDTICSFCAMMTSVRAYSSGVSMILMFNGAAKYLPINRSVLPYVCFFFFAFEVHGYVFSLFVILFSLFYRLRTVVNYHDSISQKQVNTICYGFSTIAIIFAYKVATGGPPMSVVEDLVKRVRPELIGSHWVFYALLDVSDGITEGLIIGLNWIALFFGCYCRWRIHKELASLPMSPALKEMHKSLMTILFIQIFASFTQLLALVIHFISTLHNDFQTPLTENWVELQTVVLASITPIFTLLYVKPYRNAIEKFICAKRVTPSGHVSVVPMDSVQQL